MIVPGLAHPTGDRTQSIMSNPAGQALLHETGTFDLRDGWYEAGAREDAAGPVRDRIAIFSMPITALR
jgi:hypothetical protein